MWGIGQDINSLNLAEEFLKEVKLIDNPVSDTVFYVEKYLESNTAFHLSGK
jgi:hypothetical protein